MTHQDRHRAVLILSLDELSRHLRIRGKVVAVRHNAFADSAELLLDDPSYPVQHLKAEAVRLPYADVAELASAHNVEHHAEHGERDEVAVKLHNTTDAMVWADEFVRLHGGDAGLMISWFANAIEVGRNAGGTAERTVSSEASVITVTVGPHGWPEDIKKSVSVAVDQAHDQLISSLRRR